MAKKQARPADNAGANSDLTFEVAREELEVSKREVETGVVRVRKVVHEQEKVVHERLRRQEADIQRVPVNRLLAEPVEPRYEGDTLVVPILEEVLVKQWMLKEEVRIRRSVVEMPHEERALLKSEEAIVEREELPREEMNRIQPTQPQRR